MFLYTQVMIRFRSGISDQILQTPASRQTLLPVFFSAGAGAFQSVWYPSPGAVSGTKNIWHLASSIGFFRNDIRSVFRRSSILNIKHQE